MRKPSCAARIEDRSSTGIPLTPERPMTRNGGIAETLTDVPIEDSPHRARSADLVHPAF
jgi:hypothetical protein